jgi:hypothetical protein
MLGGQRPDPLDQVLEPFLCPRQERHDLVRSLLTRRYHRLKPCTFCLGLEQGRFRRFRHDAHRNGLRDIDEFLFDFKEPMLSLVPLR